MTAAGVVPQTMLLDQLGPPSGQDPGPTECVAPRALPMPDADVHACSTHGAVGDTALEGLSTSVDMH